LKPLNIVEWPSPILTTRAEPVTVFDEELRKFVKQMHLTMDVEDGVGLAANQVGRLIRVVTMWFPYAQSRYEKGTKAEQSWWHNKRFTLINPEIVTREGKRSLTEGCLSFPGIYESITRSDTVILRAQDEFGAMHEYEADGLFATCVQHEIDHLDGIVFVDRMSRLKSETVKRKLSKRAVRA
jgi:peptide deformylase